MMRSFLRRFLFATLVMLVAIACGSSARALQSSGQQSDADQNASTPRTADPSAVPAQHTNEGQMPASGEATTQESKSFSGNIVRENNELVLKDTVTKVIYKLKDAGKAKQYLGKRVKVRGRLEMDTNTILVESIEVVM
jgi:hypothetical protein